MHRGLCWHERLSERLDRIDTSMCQVHRMKKQARAEAEGIASRSEWFEPKGFVPMSHSQGLGRWDNSRFTETDERIDKS